MAKIFKAFEWLVLGFALFFSIISFITAFGIKDSFVEFFGRQINTNILIFLWMGILWAFFAIFIKSIVDNLLKIDERANVRHERIVKTLSTIDERVNVRLTNEIGKTLSEIVKYINDYLGKPDYYERITEASKRLNGLKYKLLQGTLEEQTSAKIIIDLKKQANNIESFFACSSFPMEWWFQPEWLFYLLNQLVICSLNKVKVVRFSIYMTRPDIKRHKKEYLNFIDSHENALAGLFTLKHDELHVGMESLMQNLGLPSNKIDTLRRFIQDYMNKSKEYSSSKRGIFPDGWMIKPRTGEITCYLRDPSDGQARPPKDSTEQQAFQSFFVLLNKAKDYDSIRLDRREIEAL